MIFEFLCWLKSINGREVKYSIHSALTDANFHTFPLEKPKWFASSRKFPSLQKPVKETKENPNKAMHSQQNFSLKTLKFRKNIQTILNTNN